MSSLLMIKEAIDHDMVKCSKNNLALQKPEHFNNELSQFVV